MFFPGSGANERPAEGNAQTWKVLNSKAYDCGLTAIPPWREAWYDLPNGNCVIEKFVVPESGPQNDTLINEALEFFGREVLHAELSALQMSPGFAGRYLYPAIVQRHFQAR